MYADRRQRRAERSRGFTLLETLVALAIAAMALVGMFKAGSGGVMAVETASHVEEAIERARSHLAAVGRAAALSESEDDGDDGGGFRWHLSVHPMAVQQAGNMLVSGSALFTVAVTISWRERGRRKAVVLTSLRYVAAG